MAVKSGDVDDDDVSIPDEMRVLRRIPPGMTAPKDANSRRPSSDNFCNDPEDGSGTSVDLWDGTEDPLASLEGHDGFGLVSITVGEIRATGLGVCPAPLDDNPRHAVIQGRKTDGIMRRLARASVWIREPAPKSR
jgi:hypothetical protein